MKVTGRLANAISGATGAVAGLTPHVLHHIVPIAGTALVTGTAGSFLFGTLGFLLTVPLLLRLKQRFGTWLAPGIALVFFLITFTLSTFWIGPIIRGEDRTEGPAPASDVHHPEGQP